MCKIENPTKAKDFAKNKWGSESTEYNEWEKKFRKARFIRKSKKAKEQGYFCFYCQCKLSPDNSTYDHIIPQSQNGSEHPNNFVVACNMCNNIRDCEDFDIFCQKVYSEKDRDVYYLMKRINNKKRQYTLKIYSLLKKLS